MVVLALLGGMVAGALGVFVLVRPALVERRRRVNEVIELRTELAGTRAELAAERSVLDERLAAAVKTLSTEALDANSARFLELADSKLSGYVRPLTSSLEQMDKKLQSVERVRQEAYGALRAQVTTLSERAGSLTNALRTPHVRGRWGEAQLRNVVEYAGMVEYCDYVSQATKSTEDGLLRPDLVVRIPGGKHVVVDAKAPLAAYLDALRDLRGQRAGASPRRPRAPGPRARNEALGQGLLAAVRARARPRRHVPSRRVLPAGRA